LAAPLQKQTRRREPVTPLWSSGNPTCDVAPLASPDIRVLDAPAGVWGSNEAKAAAGGDAGIAFVLLAIGTVIYLTGLVMIEDITAFIFDKQ
jgi:hypothetical protein